MEQMREEKIFSEEQKKVIMNSCLRNRLAGHYVFPHGDGVDLSFVFEVFSFEICADPFARLGAGGGGEFNFL